MASVFKANITGQDALASSTVMPDGINYALISMTVHFQDSPAEPDLLIATLNASAGAAYDVTLYSINPSVGGIKDIVYQPTYPLLLKGGDAIDVAYANNDGNPYGVQLTFQQVF